MPFDPKIPNQEFYISEMRKAMFDKLFFLDKIDADIIVDYGCADGSMIQMMKVLFPNKIYIGFDISEEMLDKARGDFFDPDIAFTGDWNMVEGIIESVKKENSKVAIVLSSLLHEVYSYCSNEEIAEIKGRIFSGIFDYICIRDMHYKSGNSLNSIENIAKLFRSIDLQKIKDHEAVFGYIIGEKSFLHFLLKYRYDDNWKHEVAEDYFAFSMSSFGDKYGSKNAYDVIYQEEFCPMFIKNTILNDTGIDIGKAPTHLKLILRKK